MVGTNIENAIKLIKDVNKKLEKWDERSNFTVKGVRNLSMSDMDTIVLYAETYIRNGGYGFTGLMKPLGGVEKVLSKYGLIA